MANMETDMSMDGGMMMDETKPEEAKTEKPVDTNP